jgi:dipeptide/tripeptide permease
VSAAPEPGRRAAGGVLAAACVSALVVNANTSAVTILLPSISEDVGAPVAQLQWAVTGYSLVGAAVIGAGRAVALGFLVSALGFAALAFVESSWTYGAFVLPMVAIAVGLGVSNGPASSGSTSAVPPDQVGSASGISNMARYVGAAVAVAAIAMIDNAVANNHREAGESAADALAAGLAAASLTMAIWSALGVGLIVLMARHKRRAETRPLDRAAAAAAPLHTIPT